MRTSRWPLIVAITVVAAGVIASGAAFLATRRAGPELALSFVPGAATVVGQIDVRTLASSPLRDIWTQDRQDSSEQSPADALFEAVGIDVLRDVDSVTFSFAGKGEGGEVDRWGVAATGSFDRDSLLEKAGRGKFESLEHKGTAIYRFTRAGDKESAMAILQGGSMILLGETSYLRDMLDTGTGASASATALAETFGPDTFATLMEETFWVTGSSGGAIAPVLGDASFLPPVEAFALSGRLDAELILRARGRASSSESAQGLADVVRGLVALGRMNAAKDNPELKELADAVSIELVDRDVEINLRVPYETLRKLKERSRKQAEQ